jgi:hypothetical protein
MNKFLIIYKTKILTTLALLCTLMTIYSGYKFKVFWDNYTSIETSLKQNLKIEKNNTEILKYNKALIEENNIILNRYIEFSKNSKREDLIIDKLENLGIVSGFAITQISEEPNNPDSNIRKINVRYEGEFINIPFLVKALETEIINLEITRIGYREPYLDLELTYYEI